MRELSKTDKAELFELIDDLLAEVLLRDDPEDFSAQHGGTTHQEFNILSDVVFFIEDRLSTAAREGYDDGRSEGYTEGYDDGYISGSESAEWEIDQKKTEAYNEGYAEGEKVGYASGKSAGYDEGFNAQLH